MKRYSAGKNTDVRKRTEPEVARTFGPLTEEEIREIRQAYCDGCKGEILIGLRGEERVITMLLPAQVDHENTSSQSIAKLKKMGCTRYTHIFQR